MNPLTLILSIFSAIFLILAIRWSILFSRAKRQNAIFPLRINYVRKDVSRQGTFLYLELEMKNLSGKAVFLSEVQQRNIKGPYSTFLLQNDQGKTKTSLYEIREAFPNKLEIKDGQSLIRYYRMNLQPSIMTIKLYLQYRVISKNGIASESKGIWVIPSELENIPFKPRE